MALLRSHSREAGVGSGRALTVLAAALLFLGVPKDAAAQAPTPEYRLKAVFLYHFTQFVVWPPNAFRGPTDPLVLCVLGEDPFGDYLDEAVRGETVGEHPIAVRRPRQMEEVQACHILFLSASESGRMRSTIAELADAPILTVSDTDDFARMGGVVQFFTQQDRIRLRINAGAAEEAGLSISSKLLSLADVIPGSGS